MGSFLRPTAITPFFQQCNILAVRLLLAVGNILSQEGTFPFQLSLLWLFRVGQSLADMAMRQEGDGRVRDEDKESL